MSGRQTGGRWTSCKNNNPTVMQDHRNCNNNNNNNGPDEKGYTSYPQAAPTPTVQTVTPAQTAVTSVTAPPRFAAPGQPLALPQLANGTFRPTAPPGGLAIPQVATRGLHPGFQATSTFRTVATTGFQKSFRTGFHKGGSPGKGIKRKLDEGSAENGKVDDPLHPLYCKVCKVTLNAPSQAKQHYEGKNHSKKLRLYEEGKEGEDSSTNGDKTDQTSGSTNGQSPQVTAEINPEVYCKICGVSFNSPKQAHQHYQGKNHAKKVRATHSSSPHSEKEHSQSQSHSPSKLGPKYQCGSCHVQMTSQEQLDCHMKGARHAARSKITERSPITVRGQWVQKGCVGGALGAFMTSLRPALSPTNNTALLFQPAPTSPTLISAVKRPKRDFSMYRTPSGKYYCSCCNLTLNSEVQFAQHMESKKHKSSQAARKGSNNNNATNTETDTES